MKELKALDIGCGTGRMTRALAKHFAHVTGIDISNKMLTKAKEDSKGIENISFLLTSGESMEQLEDESIDFCFSFIVFQHIPDKRVIHDYFQEDKRVIHDYFQEILRVLVPGGWAKIQVRGAPGDPPGRVLWFHGFRTCYCAIILWRNWLPLPWLQRYDTILGACFTPKELKQTLRRLGFADVETMRDTPKYLWVRMKKPDHQ